MKSLTLILPQLSLSTIRSQAIPSLVDETLSEQWHRLGRYWYEADNRQARPSYLLGADPTFSGHEIEGIIRRHPELLRGAAAPAVKLIGERHNRSVQEKLQPALARRLPHAAISFHPAEKLPAHFDTEDIVISDWPHRVWPRHSSYFDLITPPTQNPHSLIITTNHTLYDKLYVSPFNIELVDETGLLSLISDELTADTLEHLTVVVDDNWSVRRGFLEMKELLTNTLEKQVEQLVLVGCGVEEISDLGVARRWPLISPFKNEPVYETINAAWQIGFTGL